MAFEEWYEIRFPDLEPELDDCYKDLKLAYNWGWCAGYADLKRCVTKKKRKKSLVDCFKDFCNNESLI